MGTEIIIAIIGVVSTIVSWALGRRRTNAEIASMQMDYIKKADVFYNERIDRLQAEVTSQAKQIRALKLIVDRMIDDACLVKQCPKREYYTPDTLEEILEGKHETTAK
jgi:hypothetical protein|nr:MAG TPA: hypothetical protein [Caudoviricetes sp.]